ncbi:MAG: DUF499 domain-containing protein [Dehalococcoidia bacterium]
MTELDNHGRLNNALALLGDTLAPYVERELKRSGAGWWTDKVLPNVSPLTRQKLPSLPKKGVNGQLGQLDVADLLSLITRNWAVAFRGKLPDAARSYAEELRNSRNEWAHKPAGGDIEKGVADRAIDTAALLLDGVDKSAAAAVRLINEEQPAEPPKTPKQTKATTAPLPGTPDALEPPSAPAAPAALPKGVEATFADQGLPAWRDIATPRPDVRSGRLTQSQFAADLHEVYRKNPDIGEEYSDAKEFFERTYVTGGVRDFLRTALRRLTNQGGDPVVQLKTGFGGGKTHTMLALYHMALSGAEIVDDVPVLKELSQELGVSLPEAKAAVLVGTKLSATAPYDDDPELKSLGISLKTLWGHMAWQLGGYSAYKLVQTADDNAVAPGEELRKVLEQASPCIILIDELVAYGRNLPTRKGQVPGGTLESTLTFIQTLTEIAKSTPGVIVAASIPESDMEIGGPQGEQVLARIQQTFGRLEAAWQPVQPTESFEVVRRRLFEEINPDGRDQTVGAFIRYYRSNSSDFPADVKEKPYEDRMRAAYPFHPELFDRLYTDWSVIPNFQSTRGVLRLLAGAVQAMWRDQDPSALIMPATIRFDLPVVREELMRYLSPAFQAVIDSDVDGASSESVHIDLSNPRFGRIGAARAAARTILLGSVPAADKGTPGIEDVRIRLGAARPGESVATYNDVLGRLRDRLQFLHGAGTRYWFEIRPNLNKTVADRISRVTEEEVFDLLGKQLLDDRDRAVFGAKHVAPTNHADVPDDTTLRLVVVSPRHAHHAGTDDSPALTWAKDVLDHRGNAPRLNRNMMVFAAFDDEITAPIVESAKSLIAWQSIVDEKKQLNLDENQARQATESRDKAAQAVASLLSEGYRWALVLQTTPKEEDGRWKVGPEELRQIDTSGRLGSLGTIAHRVSSALQHEERLLESWSPMFLKRELERWFWPQGLDHISIKKLWEENLTRYPYLPRLKDRDVFLKAIQDGATSRDFFGYAHGHDGSKYVGLSFGQRPPSVLVDDSSLIVRKEIAETVTPSAAEPGASPQGPGGKPGPGGSPPPGPTPPTAKVMKRFHGSVKLNELKVSSGAGQVAEEVIRHLTGLVGSKVEIFLEINAESEEAIPESVIRTVSENASTLKFQSFEFEED